MTSTALQTPLERPSNPPQFDIAGVKVFADRVGDQVTGHVQFPYRVYGRGAIPINYRSARPSADPALKSQISNSDSKAATRLALVNTWNRLCAENPNMTRAEVGRMVAKTSATKCSLRSLEAWSKSLRSSGAVGLEDQYTPRPRRVLSLSGELAADAVKICAWWAFRIGNASTIDSKMMHTAAALAGRGVANVLSAIDRYYSWPCNRHKMPFKSFARWAKYDFDTWLVRAADLHDQRTNSVSPAYDADNHQSPHDEFTHRPVPLQRWAHLSTDQLPSLPPSDRTRARDARDRGTVQAIAALGPKEDPCTAVLAPLDDAFRAMLIRASFKDSDAIGQAVATLPIWWALVALPAAKREEIERVTFIRPSDRRPGDDARIARSRVLMFVAELRLLRKPKAGP